MAAATVAPEIAQAAKPDSPDDPRWRPVLPLPCRLTVELSVPGFTVGTFLSLQRGSIVDTQWSVARDVPLRVNGVLVGWGELESAGHRLAVRLTELA